MKIKKQYLLIGLSAPVVVGVPVAIAVTVAASDGTTKINVDTITALEGTTLIRQSDTDYKIYFNVDPVAKVTSAEIEGLFLPLNSGGAAGKLSFTWTAGIMNHSVPDNYILKVNAPDSKEITVNVRVLEEGFGTWGIPGWNIRWSSIQEANHYIDVNRDTLFNNEIVTKYNWALSKNERNKYGNIISDPNEIKIESGSQLQINSYIERFAQDQIISEIMINEDYETAFPSTDITNSQTLTLANKVVYRSMDGKLHSSWQDAADTFITTTPTVAGTPIDLLGIEHGTPLLNPDDDTQIAAWGQAGAILKHAVNDKDFILGTKENGIMLPGFKLRDELFQLSDSDANNLFDNVLGFTIGADNNGSYKLLSKEGSFIDLFTSSGVTTQEYDALTSINEDGVPSTGTFLFNHWQYNLSLTNDPTELKREWMHLLLQSGPNSHIEGVEAETEITLQNSGWYNRNSLPSNTPYYTYTAGDEDIMPDADVSILQDGDVYKDINGNHYQDEMKSSDYKSEKYSFDGNDYSLINEARENVLLILESKMVANSHLDGEVYDDASGGAGNSAFAIYDDMHKVGFAFKTIEAAAKYYRTTLMSEYDPTKLIGRITDKEEENFVFIHNDQIMWPIMDADKAEAIRLLKLSIARQ